MATNMTDSDLRALKLLSDLTKDGRLVRPGFLGSQLWGENGYRGSACSAPYARQAGKVLNRLKARGCAEWVHEGEDWGWRATIYGHAAAWV